MKFLYVIDGLQTGGAKTSLLEIFSSLQNFPYHPAEAMPATKRASDLHICFKQTTYDQPEGLFQLFRAAGLNETASWLNRLGVTVMPDAKYQCFY